MLYWQLNKMNTKPFIRLTRFALLSALLTLFVSWGTSCFQEKGESVDKEDINTVLEANTPRLMVIAGVTIVAAGELEDGSPCIVVFVEKLDDEITEKIPTTIAGYPVDVRVSGEVRPLGSDK